MTDGCDAEQVKGDVMGQERLDNDDVGGLTRSCQNKTHNSYRNTLT